LRQRDLELKIRQYAAILFFVSVCLLLSMLSYLGHFNEFGNAQTNNLNTKSHDSLDESFFKRTHYFSIENFKPFLEMESSELSISATDGVVVSFGPVGNIYHYEKISNLPLDPIAFKSKNSKVLLKKKEVFLDNDVEIKTKNTNIQAQKFSILSEGEILYASKNVKTISLLEKTGEDLIINSNAVVYRPKLEVMEFSGNVDGAIKRKKIYEENIDFHSDFLKFTGPLNVIDLNGKVGLKKGNLEAFANHGSIFLENYNKRLKYYVLNDDVRLEEKMNANGKPILRKAFAENLEGIMSERKIVLTGLPKVFQEQDVIKGNRITIRESIETVEVEDANTNIILKKDND
jgi:lipopolysaccharide export system protein LptA